MSRGGHFLDFLGGFRRKPYAPGSLMDLSPRRTALFLDFDGTLVPIAARPDGVSLPAGTEQMLTDLHARTREAVAIVSGRSLDDLERLLPFYDGTLVGSHGAERRIGGVRSAAGPVGTDLDAIRAELAAWAKERQGVLLEAKPASLVLHYRAAPGREPECRAVLGRLANRLPDFVLRPSKMALELMPAGVSKGDAVRELMETWHTRVPVAIGDDRTDEDMFAAVQELGGYGIRVGGGETDAIWRMESVAAVHAGLRRWTGGNVV